MRSILWAVWNWEKMCFDLEDSFRTVVYSGFKDESAVTEFIKSNRFFFNGFHFVKSNPNLIRRTTQN